MTAQMMDLSPVIEQDGVVGINQKLDLLTTQVQALAEQVQFLTQKASVDQRRQEEWDDLKTDMTPVIFDMYALTVQQLEEIQQYVQLEDILFLVKRLARNTRTINEMLDQLESLSDFLKDVTPLTKDMVEQAVLSLNQLESKGYFAFLQEGRYVIDQIVTSFNQDDVRQLGDNVVLILNTVKALTQPEMMGLVNNLTQGFHEIEEQADELPTSMLGILGQMRDPDVRRGLAVTMAMLKKVSQQHRPVGNGHSLN